MLDGSFDAWLSGGMPLQSGVSEAAPAGNRPWQGPFPAEPSYLVDTAQVRAMLNQPDCCVVSIRSRAEFMGESSGYEYITARGEISGALWGHAGRDGDVNSMGSYQTTDGCMRPAAEIECLWRDAGIHRDQHIVFYCGTGWRASLAFFYAWLMGWEHISVFDGGWMEWSSDPANPVICRTPAAP
jgi:thiosulfate/3-mercaptopyruvate sulfurtransferase